jgi:hypothetical protein
VNNSAEESQRFGSIVTIEADVPPGCLGILPDPILNIGRPSKHVGGVPSPRYLDDYRLFEIEYVFVSENVHRTSALDEFLVIIGIVIRTPGDLRHIKVAWETEVPA